MSIDLSICISAHNQPHLLPKCVTSCVIEIETAGPLGEILIHCATPVAAVYVPRPFFWFGARRALLQFMSFYITRVKRNAHREYEAGVHRSVLRKGFSILSSDGGSARLR
jgi:hypothetical protein